MKKFTTLLGVFLLLVVSGIATLAQTVTVEDNVMRGLRRHGLDKSIKVISLHGNYLKAESAVRSDGSQDNRVWEFVQAERENPKSDWIHDNRIVSKIKGNGKFSYREKTGPSMQIVFAFKNGKLVSMKIDYDDHAPQVGNLTESALHVKELVSHILFRKQTGQEGISRGLDRKFAKEDAAKVAATAAQSGGTAARTSN